MTQYAAEQVEYQQHHSHDNKVAALYGTAVSMAVVAIIAVGLRLVCRQRLKLKLSYDDYTICFALVRTSRACLLCGCLLTFPVLAALGSLSKLHIGNRYVPNPGPNYIQAHCSASTLLLSASITKAGIHLHSDGAMTAHSCPRKPF